MSGEQKSSLPGLPCTTTTSNTKQESFKEEDGRHCLGADPVRVVSPSTTTTTNTSNKSTSPLPAFSGPPPPLLSPPASPAVEMKGQRLDGPPDDREGYFGHPLTKATIAINGEDQQEAHGEALLHEFLNLPAMDKQDVKIRDRGLASLINNVSRAGGKREEESTAGDNVDYMNMFLQQADSFDDNMDQLLGLQQTDGAEVTTPFPQQTSDGLIMPVKVKTEDTKGAEGEHRLQKTVVSTQGARGAARRPGHQTAGLTQGLLRRSESEPSGTLTEKLLPVREGLVPLFSSRLQQPFTSVANGRGNGPVLNGAEAPEAGEVEVKAFSSARVSSSAGAPLTSVTPAGSVAAVPESTIVPRGHCLISSSSHPTLRIASTVTSPDHAPTKAPSPRAKGRGSKGGQTRLKSGQKDGAGPEGLMVINRAAGSRNHSNKRNNSSGNPTIITSTSTAAPSPPSSTAVRPPSPPAPSAASPAVLSSTLSLGAPVSTCSVTEALGGGSSSVASSSSDFVPASAASASDSVLLMPLPHSALVAVDPDTQTLVVPTAASTLGTPATAAHLSDLPEPVRQTTKDKLKLRIAQTAMTQPIEQQQTVDATQNLGQQQQQQQQQQQTSIRQNLQTELAYQQQYKLQQQKIQQQQHQQQQHLQPQQPHQTASPREALAYLAEDDLSAMNGGGKFTAAMPNIKREDQFLDYDPQFPPPYSTGPSMQVLYNSVPMAASNSMSSGAPSGMVTMSAVNGETHPTLTEADLISQMSTEPVVVQSQFLHVLQPLDMGQPSQQQQQQQQLNNGYYNPNDNLYIYTNSNNDKVDGHLLDMDSEKSLMHYVQQQHQQQQLHDHFGYGNRFQHYMNAGAVDTSPDSGISNDQGLSPNSAVMSLKETPLCGTEGALPKESKSLKRRKSSHNPVLSRQFSSGSDKVPARNPAIQKLEVNTTGYQYFLDSPISTTQRIEEDRVTYLNKSQYYPLVLENVTPDRVPKGVTCKTVIMLVFRDEKSKEEESKAWQFWHSRQHSYKQRILDIDTKNSQGVGPNSISELAFNAVSVKWNPREGQVRVNIAVHCLSTDFSNQKGVKGIPLHIQCDTYEVFDSRKELLPTHRGYCQIKVFCDKGAERKTRDEERRRTAKATKPETTGFSPGRKRTDEVFHSPCERSEFYSMADLSTTPVYFNPSYITGEFTNNESPSVKDEDSSSQLSPGQSGDLSDEASSAKVPRLTSCASCNKHLTPLLYVKESSDKAYHAIHLEVPTAEELLKAIGHKFNKQLGTVTNFFKKSKKGILVRMDDDIIRHYSHETAFLLEINQMGSEGEVEVVLIEMCQ